MICKFACGLFSMALCLALTACTRASAGTDGPSPEVPVRAARAAVQDVPLELAAVGNVEAIQSVAVRSRVAGPVARVAFNEGDNVVKGQLLFAIDHEALDRQAAEQKALAERDAAMQEQAKAVLARDEASEKQNRSEAEVAVKLGQLGVISGQRVNQLTTTHEVAKAGLASDEASLAAASAAWKADRARLAEIELQQGLTTITAPISGRAGAVLVKAGNLVGSDDTTLVNLLQLTPVYVSFGLPEQALPEVQRQDAQGKLVVEAVGEAVGEAGSHIEGQLAFIDNTVDAATGQIRMKAIFPNRNEALWPGEFVHVRVRLRMDAAKTVIPDSSIEEGVNGKYAWVIRQGRAAMTPVSVQRVYAREDAPGLAVIAEGIRPGDLVVTEGQLRLTAGARVSILSGPKS